MPPTPWTKKSALTSDRLRSTSSSPSNANQAGKGKGKARDASKSKEIRKLETLANGIRGYTGDEKDPKGGCFCLGDFNSILQPIYTSVDVVCHGQHEAIFCHPSSRSVTHAD